MIKTMAFSRLIYCVLLFIMSNKCQEIFEARKDCKMKGVSTCVEMKIDYLQKQLQAKEEIIRSMEKQISDLQLSSTDTPCYCTTTQQPNDETTTQSLTSKSFIYSATLIAPARDGEVGREFLFAVPTNHNGIQQILRCIIVSPENGWYFIDVPYLDMHHNRTLNERVNTLDLSTTMSVTNFKKENKGVFIQTSTDSIIYMMNLKTSSTTSEGFYVIPVQSLSDRYIVVSEEPYGSQSYYSSQIIIAALEDKTDVNITLNTNGSILYNNRFYGNKQTLTVNLDQYETFGIEHKHDLTGSIVQSSAHVAVLSGNKCGNVFVSDCSHMSEMIIPTKSLSQIYVIPTFNSYDGNRYARIVGAHDNTMLNYSINGVSHTVIVDTSGKVDIDISRSSFVYISASKPILVAELVRLNRGPFLVTFPGVDQYLSNYSFNVPDFSFTSYVNIIIKTPYADGLRLDGVPITPTFSIIGRAFGTDNYTLIDHRITPGYHNIYQENNETFGLLVYGFQGSDGYGYFADMKFRN